MDLSFSKNKFMIIFIKLTFKKLNHFTSQISVSIFVFFNSLISWSVKVTPKSDIRKASSKYSKSSLFIFFEKIAFFIPDEVRLKFSPNLLNQLVLVFTSAGFGVSWILVVFLQLALEFLGEAAGFTSDFGVSWILAATGFSSAGFGVSWF